MAKRRSKYGAYKTGGRVIPGMIKKYNLGGSNKKEPLAVDNMKITKPVVNQPPPRNIAPPFPPGLNPNQILDINDQQLDILDGLDNIKAQQQSIQFAEAEKIKALQQHNQLLIAQNNLLETQIKKKDYIDSARNVKKTNDPGAKSSPAKKGKEPKKKKGNAIFLSLMGKGGKKRR